MEIKPHVVIRHYTFRTIEEFLYRIKRGEVNGRRTKLNYEQSVHFNLKRFFRYNKITFEKIECIYKYLKNESTNEIRKILEKK